MDEIFQNTYACPHLHDSGRASRTLPCLLGVWCVWEDTRGIEKDAAGINTCALAFATQGTSSLGEKPAAVRLNVARQNSVNPAAFSIHSVHKHGNHCIQTVRGGTRSCTGAETAAGCSRCPCRCLPARLRQDGEHGSRRGSGSTVPELGSVSSSISSSAVIIVPGEDTASRRERERVDLGACRRFLFGLPGESRAPAEGGQVSPSPQVQRVQSENRHHHRRGPHEQHAGQS